MTRLALALTLVVVSFLGSTSQASDEAAEWLEQGLAAYSRAQTLTDRDARIAAFGQAERLFSQAAESGYGNADLYANTGTAALQAERLGAAVLAFRRALRVDPGHARAVQNLAEARALLPDWVPKPEPTGLVDTFFSWHRTLSVDQRLGSGALAFLLACTALAAGIVWRSRLARGLTLLPAAAWAALMASVAVGAYNDEGSAAVINVEDTVARASDSANAPVRFPEALPAGVEVEVLETRDRWARIRLANDREAWVSRQSIEFVGMPDS